MRRRSAGSPSSVDDGLGDGSLGSGAPSRRQTSASGSHDGVCRLYPSGHVCPSRPSSPSFPFSPGGPAGPAGPAGPVGPTAPADPGSPSVPRAPTAPSAPSTPSAPFFPGDPAGPGEPDGPGFPGGPESPGGPDGPRGPVTEAPRSPRLPGGPATGVPPMPSTWRASASRAPFAACRSRDRATTWTASQPMKSTTITPVAAINHSARGNRRCALRALRATLTVPPPPTQQSPRTEAP